MAHYKANPGTCTAEGCETPRAGLPSRVPGGETLCRRHRQHLRMNQMRAAGLPANGRADLLEAVKRQDEAASASKPIAAEPPAVKPAQLADAPTLTRDPMLASITPIADATEAPSAPRVVATSPTPPVIDLPDLRVGVPRIELRASALRVYVAASKTLVVHARAAADELRHDGRIQVVSRWHDILEEGAEDPLDYAALKRILSDNLDDLRSCDVVLALTCRDAGRGVYGEIGRALEMGKLVVWSLQRGGRCQDLADERVIEAATDAQAIQVVRILAEFRRVA